MIDKPRPVPSRATKRPAAAAAAATLAALAVGLMTAAPAMAAPPVIVFSSPTAGARVTTSATKVDAKVTMTDGRLKSISLAVTPVFGGGAVTNPAPVPGGDVASKDVSFPLTFALNGRYKAEITATGNDTVLGLGADKSTKAAVEFAVVAPPTAPRGVKTAVDVGTRETTVTWTRNTEADHLYYLVQRALGGGEYVLAAKTTDASVLDGVTALAGGEYSYQVLAVRKGAAPDEVVGSAPSSATAAAVPAPPAPPPTVAPETPPSTVEVPASVVPTSPTVPASPPATAPPTTASTIPAGSPGALPRPGTVDLSGLRALQAQPPPRRVSPPTTADTGFGETLPFDTSAIPEELPTDLGPEGGAEFDETAFDDTELGAESDIEKTRALAFLAAGLLATVLLMHVLWVRGEVARVPLESLPPAPVADRGQKRPKDRR
ncbi:MAG: hypothetical protein ACRDY5_10455, partial [Acidimicrobiales bacterium]